MEELHLDSQMWSKHLWVDRLMQGQRLLSLNDAELTQLNAMVEILKDTSHFHTSAFADTDMNIFIKLLTSWPVQMLFPG
jgi:phospholipase A-2-activating protein